MDKNAAYSILMLSGGMDSAVLLAHTIRSGKNLTCLSFNYGSKHNERELDCARGLCEVYHVEHTIIDLTDIFKFFDSSLLKKGDPIPEGGYNDTNIRSTVVPFRNGIMLSAAVGLAENIGAKEVIYGAHRGDHPIYPDCREEFVSAVSKAAEAGTYNNVKILSPFGSFSKKEIAKLGVRCNLDFRLTWSCYMGGRLHCGRCATCLERKKALEFALGEDPTIYA